MAVSKYSSFLYLILVIVVFYVTEIICLVTLHTGVTGLVILFGVLPLVFRCSAGMQRFFVFLNFIQWPRSFHLTNPENLGLEGARNIYLKVHSNITGRPLELGVWHILPSMYKNWSRNYVRNSSTDGLLIEDEGSAEASLKDTTFDALLAKGDRPIILYAHGNANNRGCLHRVELYKRLQDMNFHVVAFDYRSYGDSTQMRLSELGVVEDTILVYNWILEKLGQKHHKKLNTPVFFWGHSLGTGITSHALAVLANNGLDSGIVIPNTQPAGLILESPFNNFYEELQGHVLGKIYSWIPWFHWSIVDPVVNSGFQFKSDEHIATFAAPVLILHARGDRVVPYELGEKLHEAALSKRPKGFGPVEMVTFPESDNLGHKNIYTVARLPDIIRNFVDQHSTIQKSHGPPVNSEEEIKL